MTYKHNGLTIHHGDALAVLRSLSAASVHCCVTSPPYWGLRDYGESGQLGLEPTPEEYVESMVSLFAEVRRVLRDDGTCWLNLGDSYSQPGQQNRNRNGVNPEFSRPCRDGVADEGHKISSGLKPKDLCGIPWRVAFALQSDGWYLRQDIIWHKPNPMPESVRDRCTKAHEYIFLLSKSAKYYYDAEAISEELQTPPHAPGNKARADAGHMRNDIGTDRVDAIWGKNGTRNRRSVWTVATRPYPGAHFATFPPKLIEPCIKAGCPEGGTVLDPFLGSGTTAEVARDCGCKCVGIELNADYIELAKKRNSQGVLGFS